MSHPPYHKYPPQLAPQEPDVFERVETRLIRLESRMVRLMEHMGLRADGTPKDPPSHPGRRSTDKPLPFNQPHWTEK